MRLGVFKGEPDLSTLARRLYNLEGPGGEKRARNAEEALLRTNPQLRRPDRLASGAPIVVPDLPDTEPVVEPAATPGTVLVGDSAEAMKQSLRDIQVKVSASIEGRIGEIQASAELLKSRQFRRAVKDTPMEGRLKELGEQRQAQLKRIQAMQVYQQQVFAQIERDLDQFVERLR